MSLRLRWAKKREKKALEKKSSENDQSSGHFQSFFIIFFFVPSTQDVKKISRKSTNKKILALILSNFFSIVTAFILDMFIYEYTFCKKGSIDTKVEATIKNLQLGIDDET